MHFGACCIHVGISIAVQLCVARHTEVMILVIVVEIARLIRRIMCVCSVCILCDCKYEWANELHQIPFMDYEQKDEMLGIENS